MAKTRSKIASPNHAQLSTASFVIFSPRRAWRRSAGAGIKDIVNTQLDPGGFHVRLIPELDSLWRRSPEREERSDIIRDTLEGKMSRKTLETRKKSNVRSQVKGRTSKLIYNSAFDARRPEIEYVPHHIIIVSYRHCA
jgi:hypothetical protein